MRLPAGSSSVHLISSAVLWLILAANFCIGAKSDSNTKCAHQCVDGTCLKLEQVCNGSEDCSDGSDEVDCDYRLCREPDWFKCKNNKCISHALVCDEDNDCGDWSDESYDCTYKHKVVNETCLAGQFRCNDGFCIPFEWVCNGRSDCPDGSDEEQKCNVKQCDGFHCRSGQCIFAEFHCDGSQDCGDGSDEEDCPFGRNSSKLVPTKMSECVFEKGFYACADEVTCITVDSLCNNHSDCLGGDDEGGQCSSLPDMCKKSGCSHSCHPSPKGPLCSCPHGYILAEGSTEKCEDIDECKLYGSCGQRCHNFQGGYACSCEDGYVLAADEKSCISEEGSEASLVYSTSKEIRMYTLSSQHLSKVQSRQLDVTAVVYDGRFVYWSSQEDGLERIMRSRDDGSKREVVVSSGLSHPEDMAWDWITRTLYFTDSGMQTISACTEDGHWCSVLVNTVTDKPHGIVVVPQEGTMFWTDWGTQPHVAQAGMDGSNPSIFISEDLHWPNSIALDYGNKRLYWVDAKFHYIESVNLDGSDRRVVLKLPVSDAFSIAIFENKLYWSNSGGKEISSCDKFTGKNHSTIVTERKNAINSLSIYHPALQIRLTNPCERSKCSHMCLLAPKGKYSCGCPSDMYLGRDKYTCVERSKVAAVLVGAGNYLIKVEHQLLGRLNVTYVPLQNVNSITAITYNPRTNAAIISDSSAKKIISVDLRKLSSTTLIDSQLGNVMDMEYDSAGGNLYFCDFERKVVEAYSFATGQRVVIARDLQGDFPISIAITPANLMFVGLTANRHQHIDTMSLDGQDHTHAMEELSGPPSSLTFHKGLHRVFWVDDESGVIQSTDDEALDLHEWRREKNEPVSMAALGNLMFWSSKGSPYLHWADVQNGQSKMTKLKLNVDKSYSMYLTSIDQPEMPQHACQDNNGGCSHVCFALQAGAKCGCPLGMHLKNGLTCTTPSHCSKKEFKCSKDDICIPKSLRCNGSPDCPSGEDEEGCEITCEPGMFTCKNGDCIMQHQRCDGHTECKDGSDEESCESHFACDLETEYTCFSGECVSRSLVCDGFPDCKDGSDEDYCQDTSCSPEQFRCVDGTCIPKSWECDGSVDCKDGSDEHHKCVKESCQENDFSCKNGQCVDKKLVCDGQDDCGDGSDEVCEETNSRQANTTLGTCPEDSFTCETSSKLICLPESSRCNGVVECPFGDDESNCGCGDDTFECRSNRKCIPIKWKCDGFNDCRDGSDESDCDTNTIAFSPPLTSDCEEFRCSSGECLRFSKVCNGKNHCSDGSDEGGKCELSCDEKKQKPCSQNCIKTPKGPRCSCNLGYILAGDGRSCLDINECDTEPELCSHFCRNTPGSYVCSCAKGYSLRSDRQSCKAIANRSLGIVFVTNEEIREVTLKTKRTSILTSHTGLTVSGLVVDAKKHHVYWSTAATGKLTRMSRANEVEQQIQRIIEKPKKLALDWVTSNVYVVDQLQFPTVKVCSVDEEKCAKLFSTINADEITSIVLDPSNGYLFWSELSVSEDKRPKSEIWRSDMDGRNASAIVSSGLAMVSGLALDLVKKQIYWSDQGQGAIEFANYEGSQRHLLPIKELQRPVGVALFEDDIYWMDGGSGKLSKRSLRYPYDWKHVELHAYDAVHFQLVHEALQPEGKNVCESISCDQGMCVLSPFGPRCVCESSQECSMNNGASNAAGDVVSSNDAGAVLLALFLTIIAIISVAFVWFVMIKKQGDRLHGLFKFRNLKFERDSVRENLYSKGVRFNANVIPAEHQFINPIFTGKPSGFEQQPLKSIGTTSASSSPGASGRRTIPVDIPTCPSESSSGTPEYEMSPPTCSPNACLISLSNED